MDAHEYENRHFFILVGNRRAILLQDPKPLDMFWWSFTVVPLDDDPIFTREFWSDRVFTVEDEIGRRFDGVFAGTRYPERRGDRVGLRGLKLGPAERKDGWLVRFVAKRLFQ